MVFLVIGNEVIKTRAEFSWPQEQIITNVQDGRLRLNDSLTIEDVQLSHGLLNLHNALSTLDFEFDDALEDIHILNAVANSINEWKQRKNAKNKTYNGVNKKRVKRDEEVVCYRNFGCFRDEGPFDYLDTLPASPDIINTTFTLYTREQKSGEPLDYLNISTLTGSKMSNERPIKIIIHGFGSSGKRPWVVQMTEALIYMEDVIVIVVDWEAGAALPNYVQAAANTQLVGKQIARLINAINKHLKFEAKDYHLIGFSLGAHVAGFAGAEIKNISRITGLDPASPLFEGYSVRARLDPSDAKFVDVIHSNGDSFLKGGLGSFQAMGHLDFYPNGGRVQVGCNSVLVGALTDIFYGKWQSLCHHRRAFRFFIDSLVPSCRFHAFACDSYERFLKGECFNCGESGRRCANMGYYASSSKGRGKMYLMTRNKEPFCANQYKIRILSSNTQHSTWGKLEISFISKDANETFPLTSESDEIKDKAILQGLVVAHPIIRNITHVLLKYTKYRGWIYSGKDFWAVDKIILQNSDGEVFTYCGFNTIIQNNESVLLDLEPKNCTLYEPSTDLPTARVARLIWKVVSTPIRPPGFLWRLTDYNPINKFNYPISSNGMPGQTALANYNGFNLQTNLYNLNPNLINTLNQKQSFSTYSTLNSNINNLNTNLNQNLNPNLLKGSSFARHLTTPTAITTSTISHQENLNNMNIFKLNNGASIGQMQNELEFNEMQTIPQKVVQQQLNLNQNLNLDELEHHNQFNSSQIIQLNQSSNSTTFNALANNLSNKTATLSMSSLEIN